jgi:hypothetical protein
MPRRAGLVVGVVLCLVALSACTADLGPTISRFERSDARTPDAVVTAEQDGDALLQTVE